MNIIQGFSDNLHIPDAYLSIGVFDGVHIGHQAVLKTLIDDARRQNGTSCVITFHPHPLRLLRPNDAPPQITSTGHKMQLLASLGIDYCFVLKFDTQLAHLDPEEFINTLLLRHFTIREICVGYDCTFGKDKAGTLDLLVKTSSVHNFVVKQINPVKIDTIVVSSSMIRRLIIAGELDLVEIMCGRKYSLWGTVIKGDTIGRKIGYPTANLDPHHEAIPPSGVYIVQIRMEGATYPGIMNIGYRPTFFERQDLKEVIEVHILDFDNQLYNKEMEVIFVKKLREERRFSNTNLLIRQIQQDELETRRYFGLIQ